MILESIKCFMHPYLIVIETARLEKSIELVIDKLSNNGELQLPDSHLHDLRSHQIVNRGRS